MDSRWLLIIPDCVTCLLTCHSHRVRKYLHYLISIEEVKRGGHRNECCFINLPHIHQLIHPSIHPSTYPSIHLFNHLPNHSSIHHISIHHSLIHLKLTIYPLLSPSLRSICRENKDFTGKSWEASVASIDCWESFRKGIQGFGFMPRKFGISPGKHHAYLQLRNI